MLKRYHEAGLETSAMGLNGSPIYMGILATCRKFRGDAQCHASQNEASTGLSRTTIVQSDLSVGPAQWDRVWNAGRRPPPRLTKALSVRHAGVRRGRGRRCGCLRAWNGERLADLQFPVIFDMVEFLQLVDADLVHFRD